ncbi:MAG: flagellar basal body P-ring formation chaperone FlgA [Sphingopyxis sp.]
MRTIVWPCLMSVALYSATASAQSALQNLDALDTLVQNALAENDGTASARPIDRRLRLQRCAGPIEVSGPELGAMIVRCPQAAWRIRVPLVAPTAVHQQREHSSAPAAPLSSLIPNLIRRGDQVQIILAGRNFMVRSIGFADQDGAVGQRIRVRNERRTEILTGMVQNDGSVIISGIN